MQMLTSRCSFWFLYTQKGVALADNTGDSPEVATSTRSNFSDPPPVTGFYSTQNGRPNTVKNFYIQLLRKVKQHTTRIKQEAWQINQEIIMSKLHKKDLIYSCWMLRVKPSLGTRGNAICLRHLGK